MTLFHPALVVFAPLVPALMGVALWLYTRRRRRVAALLGERELVGRITGADLHAVPWTRVMLLLAAAAALGIAAADPRWGMAAAAVERPGLDLVFVLDVSNSMLAEDAPSRGGMGGDPAQSNRLERQRDAAARLTRALRADRIGIVAFAGRAYILAPPTLDHGAVEMYLDALGPEMVEQTGSSLAAALRQGTNLLAPDAEQPRTRVLVLVSDGEVHEEREAVLAAARRASAARLPVLTLGVGSAAGAPVPDIDLATGERRGYKMDPISGERAISRLDEELLREIARTTAGAYFHVDEADALPRLLARLDAEERGRGAGAPRRAHAPRYGWFVALAVLCLAADALRERPRRLREE